MKRLNQTLILASLCLAVLLPSCKKTDNDNAGTQTVDVGALLSLTGNWSSLGVNSKAAIEIALEDINKYQVETGSKYRFTSTIYDTKLDATLAKKYMAEAKNKGITFVLGPQSSAEAGALKPYADSGKMIIVSQGSTAGSLSIANDNLFRFCPDDHIEGAAMANTIYKAGIKGLVTVARNDAGNKGLQSSTGTSFTALGGTIAATTPYGDTATDFTALLADVKAKVQAFTAIHGTSGTAVYLASFDEFTGLFEQAASDPVLSSVNWYGGDGVALSAALLGSPDAADFAIATHYFAPTFGLPEHAHTKWEPLAAEIKQRTGLDPDAFALATYDAFWVIALTYNATANNPVDFKKLRNVFIENANNYYGTTGPTLLNEAGDRALGSFDYWGMTKEGGAYKWKLVGKSE